MDFKNREQKIQGLSIQKLALALFILGQSIVAYTHVPDSILEVVKGKYAADRIDFYSQKIYDFARNNPQASRELIDSVFILLEQSPNSGQEIYALRGAAMYQLHQNQYDSAFYYVRQAELLNKKIGDTIQQAGILIDYGNIHMAKTTSDSALFYYLAADSIAKLSNSLLIRGVALLNISSIYQKYFHDYEKSMQYLGQAYDLREHISNLNKISLFQKMAIAYRYLGNDSLSLKMAQQSYDLAMSEGLQGDAAAAINSMAQIYQEQGYYQNALEAFEKAREIAVKLKLTKGIIFTNGNIAETYFKMERYREGLDLYQKILKIVRENNYEQLHPEIYKNMIRFYEKLGNFKLAFETSEKLRMLDDSLTRAVREEMITEMETRYQTNLKEETIANQETRINKNRTIIWLLSALVFLFLASLVATSWLFMLKNKSLKKLVKTHKELTNKNKQILKLIPCQPQVESDDLGQNQDFIYQKIYGHLITSQKYLDSDLTLEKLAADTSINREYIRSAIKNIEGCNFKTFVNNHRIDHAKRLIMGDALDQLSIEEIARQSGFSSRTSFYRTFHDITGFTPVFYKNELRKNAIGPK